MGELGFRERAEIVIERGFVGFLEKGASQVLDQTFKAGISIFEVCLGYEPVGSSPLRCLGDTIHGMVSAFAARVDSWRRLKNEPRARRFDVGEL